MLPQQLVQKSVITVLLVLIFFLVLSPRGLHELRVFSYQLFKYGAELQLAQQTKDYAVLTGENFIVKYQDSDRELAPFVLATAESFYQAVQERLAPGPGKRKITLVIYPDTEALNASFGWGADKSAMGVYWAGSIRVLSPQAWLPEATSLAELQEVFLEEGPLSHELAHLIVDYQTGGNYTRWLTEGIAQYLEREIAGFTLDEPWSGDRDQLYSLKELENNFDQLENQILAYWQSLQIVDYLLEQHGPEKIHELLTVLRQGEKVEKAFLQVYGLSLETLEKEVYSYIHSPRENL